MTGWSLSVPVCLLGLTEVQMSENVEECRLDFYQLKKIRKETMDKPRRLAHRAMDSVTDRCNRKLQIERQPQ
ncbi:hypothetical protein ASPFODRAFT_39552 [Aspergillus luchuensis CBS 106.47]|uniref:Uncharacterized protein n=1 Tax=Aspergillus luchuensis (strain CBS 106.47) TaxID=1137211 RepID=A0A1M3TZN6_ASPLC|nr:hypothetical protein ASPFODRAFT_39552 [Aspergillus luchuensis CBS 106.47]